MSVFHPDLAAARFLPRLSQGPVSSALMRKLRIPGADSTPEVTITERSVPGPAGAPPVGLRIFEPVQATKLRTVLLWIHGGGHVIGSAQQDDRTNIAFARELGITVVAVRYRLGAVAPAPAAVEDAYAALLAVVDLADELSIDVDRIAVGGASAGAGIAAGLALLAHDRGRVHPAFQLLVYPMLDDRTVTRIDLDTRNVRVWTPKSNRYGWTTYLGQKPGSEGVSEYAAPSRREDLTGLPSAWIGVGSLDLFHDEDLEYARRLTASGVECEIHVVSGAFHGFDALFPKASVSADFWQEQAEALRRALLPAS